jgi:hypothetical protein
MGEVLAAGVTHYPALMGTDESMSWVLRWTLEDPDIPESAKDPAGWPESMRAEWGDDFGKAAAAAHRERQLGGFRKVRAALDEFNPDVIIIWGDDQYENFHEDVIPPFAVFAYDDLIAHPWQHAKFANVWGEPAGTERKVAGHREAGIYLAGKLIEDNFDLAYAYKPLHHDSLPHSFLNAIMLLDYDRAGFPYPVLPMAINCYGRRVISFQGGRSRFAERSNPVDPPGPNPSRCFDFGAAVARAALQSPWRVALLASSSWSHAFLTDHTWRLWPDVVADRRLYDALVAGDFAPWRAVTTAQLEEAGQQELLNWFCLAGAVSQLGVAPKWSTFVETHVFNSNKVFAIYPPVARS